MNKIKNTEIPFFDHCFDKNRLKKWIKKIYTETLFTEDLTILNFIETLKTIGFKEATLAGVSIGIEDLLIPPKKTLFLKQIEQEIQITNNELNRNRLTALEDFQNFIDIWHRTSETLKREVVSNFEMTDRLNPVYMMAFSGARGNLSQVTQLVGMRGFMSDPEGQIIDYPIRSNFREGLTLTEYVISCYGARKGLVDTALRTADAGYLTRRLVDVAHSLVIVKFDCQTNQGIWLSEIQTNSKTVYSLQNRLVGRVLAQDIFIPFINPKTKQKTIIRWSYFQKNQQLDLKKSNLLASCFKRVLIRSPLRCLKKKRLCQLCYGWTLPHAHLAPIGEAVGILAAQSIGEPGTQLTMRTFHTGGVFSGALSEDLKAPETGIIQYNKSLKGALFRTSNGQIAFRTQEPGILFIQSNSKPTLKKPLFQLNFPTGSILFLKQNEIVTKNQLLIELPKQQTIESETVLNTYTYYANRSGLLKLTTNKIGLNTNNEAKLILHRKLPKLDKFYERASYIQPNLYSLRIYSGQVSSSFHVQKTLPKEGDIVNTKSLLTISQLITNKSSSYYQLSKNKTDNYSFNNPFFQLSLLNIHYRYLYGYILNLKKSSYFLITSKFQNNFVNINCELNVLQKQNLILNEGFLFQQNKCILRKNNHLSYIEKWIFFNQKQKIMKFKDHTVVFDFKKIESKLISFSKKLISNKIEFRNTQFFIPQKLSATSFITKKHVVARDNFDFKSFRIQPKNLVATAISKGFLLSNSHNVSNQSDQLSTDTTCQIEFNNIKWVKKNNLISFKRNLQNKYRPFRLNKNGFLVQFKKGLNDSNKINLIKNWKHKSQTYFWLKPKLYTIKLGWPYNSFENRLFDNFHNQIHFSDLFSKLKLSFSNKPIFTEYVLFTVSDFKQVNALKRKPIYLKKTNLQLNKIEINSFVLLFKNIENYSFLRKKNNEVHSILYKNDSLKLVYSFIQLSFHYKLQILNIWFQQFSKQIQTSNNSYQIKENQLFSITLSEYSNFQNFFNTENNKSFKWCDKPLNMSQTLVTISPSINGKNANLTLIGQNPLQLLFVFQINEFINDQNFFKNSDSKELDTSIYIKKKWYPNSKICTGFPIFESYLFNSHEGEIYLQKENLKFNQINSLILTNDDTCTLKSNYLTRQCQIGDILTYGTEMNQSQTSSSIGQVIQITKNYIKLQLLENSLVGSNSRFFCTNDQFIQKTNKIFTQSYPRLQMGDIVQGIPKIEEFFEARRTKEGVFFENNLHDRLRNRFKFYKNKCRYPFMIACRKSTYDIQKYIIDSIFKLYNSQGIDISDKHLEVIVRQMTSKVRITQFWANKSFMPYKHPLPGEFYSRQYVEKYLRYRKNEETDNVRYAPAILGITQAALENDGFISAASFQETTRILSQGAIFQKKDYLKGLKENVIVGHIIPAGTAVRTYTRRYKPPIMEQVWKRQGLQILSVNYHWKMNKPSFSNSPMQYFNPIRLTILRILLFSELPKL